MCALKCFFHYSICIIRYYITKNNVLVMASEIGVYDVEPGDVFQKGRLRPGRMLLVDMENKTVIRDEEMKRTISESRPHGKWWREHLTLRDFVSWIKMKID